VSNVAHDIDVEKVLKGIKIPSPPQVIADLQMEMSMPDPDLKEMAKLISNDAGLSGAVIKIANSPYYTGNEKVTSISQAILLLGMRTLMNIINTICIKNETLSTGLSDDTYATLLRFWDSATDVAKVCSMIANKLNIVPHDYLYTLGLFHNVGITLMINKFDNYLEIMRQSYAQSEKRIVDVENDMLGTNHAVLGYYTAKSWKLDDHLCQIIAQHHNNLEFMEKQTDESQELRDMAILKIAQHVAGVYRVLGGQDEDVRWDMIKDNVLLVAGLTNYELDELIDQAKDSGIAQQQYFR